MRRLVLTSSFLLLAAAAQAATLEEELHEAEIAEALLPSSPGLDAHRRAVLGVYLHYYCPTGEAADKADQLARMATLSRLTKAEGIDQLALDFSNQCRPSAWQPPWAAKPVVPHRETTGGQ